MKKFEEQVEEMLTDDSFIAYCQRKDDREIAVWETRLLTQPELLPVVQEAKERVKMMAQGLIGAEMEAGLLRLKNSVLALSGEQAPIADALPFYSRYKNWIAAAGVMAVLLGSWIFYTNTKTPAPVLAKQTGKGLHINVPAGEHKSMHLPDGSLVILNGGSDLQVSEGFDKTDRLVTLTGEAYFDIKQNAQKPFMVNTKTMQIKVLGTAFNVRSYPDETTSATSLIRGKVEVSLLGAEKKTKERYVLKPMQKLVVETPGSVATLAGGDRNAIRVDSLVKDNMVKGFPETAWTEHNLVFHDESLEQAAQKMEKWFGITISFKNDQLRKLKYTGTFENDDLEKVLKIMKLSIPDIHYSIEKSKVILY